MNLLLLLKTCTVIFSVRLRLSRPSTHIIKMLSILQNEFDNFVEVRDPDVPEFEKEVAKVQKRLNLYLQQTISFTEDKELAPLRNKVQSQLSQISKDLAKSRKKHTEDRKKSSESDKDKGE